MICALFVFFLVFAGCVLFVVRCVSLLFVIARVACSCSLFVVRRSLLVGVCYLWFVVFCVLRFIVCSFVVLVVVAGSLFFDCVLFLDCCLLFVVCGLLFVVMWCSLVVVRCVCVVCCLLSLVCC